MVDMKKQFMDGSKHVNFQTIPTYILKIFEG